MIQESSMNALKSSSIFVHSNSFKLSTIAQDVESTDPNKPQLDQRDTVLTDRTSPSTPDEIENHTDDDVFISNYQILMERQSDRRSDSPTIRNDSYDLNTSLTSNLSVKTDTETHDSMIFEVNSKSPLSPLNSTSISLVCPDNTQSFSPRETLMLSGKKLSNPIRLIKDSPRSPSSDRELGQHFGSIPVWNEDGDGMIEEEVVDVEEVVLLHLLQENNHYRCIGGVYTGSTNDGKMHGVGKYVWANGDVYEGEYKENRMHGHGIFTSAIGWIYEGYFYEDHHGRGKFSWPNTIHSGEFKNGKMNGFGKYTWKDGTVYEGEFKDGMKHGHGMIKRSDGCVYEGNWFNDMRHGYGKYTWKDGDVYEGYWSEDKRSGKGKLTYINGDVYEGEYKSNKRDGYGTHTCKNGNIYSGEWKEDNIHGQGVSRWSDGDSYEGQWMNSLKHGIGKYTWPDGHYYSGQWEYNQKHGHGEYQYTDGRMYIGHYSKDKMHGIGKFINVDKSCYEGEWKDGIYYRDMRSISNSVCDKPFYSLTRKSSNSLT